MHGTATMGGWVDVENGCPISCDVLTHHVELAFGGRSGDFTMVIEFDALRALNQITAAALAKAARGGEG